MPAEPPDQTRRATIVIVDDHSMVRRGLTALIDNEPDLVVCGDAATCEGALEVIGQSPPELVIVDLSLGGGDDGLDLVKDMKVRHPKIPVLVLSMHAEAVYAERALRAGARLCLQATGWRDRVDRHPSLALRRDVHERRARRAIGRAIHRRARPGAGLAPRAAQRS